MTALIGLRCPLIQLWSPAFAEGLNYEQHADRDDEERPKSFDPQAMEAEFLKLQSDSGEDQEAAPETPSRALATEDGRQSPNDQEQRPEAEDAVGVNQIHLIEKQRDASNQDKDSEDEASRAASETTHRGCLLCGARPRAHAPACACVREE